MRSRGRGRNEKYRNLFDDNREQAGKKKEIFVTLPLLP